MKNALAIKTVKGTYLQLSISGMQPAVSSAHEVDAVRDSFLKVGRHAESSGAPVLMSL